MINNLPNVDFLTPQGKKVLIVFNSNNTTQAFGIQFNNKYAAAVLPAGSVATYVW
jgi:glucosylceramidase